jgi:cytochrome c-type biogenesis protein CcmH
LWLLPPLALAGGGLALWAHGRRRMRLIAAQESSPTLTLSADEEARLQKLMAGEISPDTPV